MFRCFTVHRSGRLSNSGGLRVCWAVLALVACAQANDTSGIPEATSGRGRAEGGARATTLNAAEWRELTAPPAGVHEVWDAACGGQLISQDYRIVPSIGCAARRDERGRATLTRDCAVIAYCTTAADCAAQARGVCNGHAYASCEYPGVEAGTRCERDPDCSALPGGACTPRIEGGGELCYPTGECNTTPMQGCSYPALGQPCAVDADCAAAPGGSCTRTIAHAECTYNECDGPDDCGPAARCECLGTRQCIPASCFSDRDCDAGYRCEPTLALECGNLKTPVGYHCHAVNDDCQSDADCDPASCVFDPEVAHWTCRDTSCVTR